MNIKRKYRFLGVSPYFSVTYKNAAFKGGGFNLCSSYEGYLEELKYRNCSGYEVNGSYSLYNFYNFSRSNGSHFLKNWTHTYI